MSEILEPAELATKLMSEEEATASEGQPVAERQPGQSFEIAVLALQNTTLFPETVVPLAEIGRAHV